MPLCNALPDLGTGILGPVGIVSMNGPDELHARFMESPLALFVIAVRTSEAFEPLLGDLLQELRDALLFGAGSLLQAALQAGRKTPTVDLGLRHARHCSAGGSASQPGSVGYKTLLGYGTLSSEHSPSAEGAP